MPASKRALENWHNQSAKPTMRVEMRIVILDRAGVPLREFERFWLDFRGPRRAVEQYRKTRKYYAKLKRSGEHALADDPLDV